MRVIQLKADNFKRLSAIDITPGEGSLITIAGKNDQGKSSVIDAIAVALGGAKLAPKQPIRGDNARADIVVNLGDYTVTRRFTRRRLDCDCEHKDGDVDMGDGWHLKTCASLTKWTPIESTLTVTNADGARFPSPQALLEKLVGELTFDPLAFLELKPDAQTAILRKLAGLDFTKLDAERLMRYNERTVINRDVNHSAALLKAALFFPDLPADEISVEELVAEIHAADQARKAARFAAEDAERATTVLRNSERERLDKQEELRELLERVRVLKDEIDGLDGSIDAERTIAENAQTKATELAAAVPDVTTIETKIRETTVTNEKIRANQLHANIKRQLESAEAAAAEKTKAIEAIDADRAKQMAAAKFPIDGLAISDDGPTFGGMLLEQASTAAKLRVSVAMGLALNPKLKVLLVHEGNDLDDDSLTLLGELAAAAGAQVWLERIAGRKDGVSIVIEDGAVKEDA